MVKYRVRLEDDIEDGAYYCVYRRDSVVHAFIHGWTYISSHKTLEKAKDAIARDRKNPVHEE